MCTLEFLTRRKQSRMLWSSCREVQKISGGKCVPISHMKKMFQEANTNKWSQNCWNYSFSPGTHFDFTSGKTKSSWLFFPCRWHKSIPCLSLILSFQPFKWPRSVFTFALEFYPLSLPPKSFNIHGEISSHTWIILPPHPFVNKFYSFFPPTHVCHFLFTLLPG